MYGTGSITTRRLSSQGWHYPIGPSTRCIATTKDFRYSLSKLRPMLEPFHERHRDLANRETAVLVVTEGSLSLPLDQYWFVEWYCIDPECDCRRVRLVVTPLADPGRSVAVISWGWETREFYRKWLDDEDYARNTVKGCLEEMMPQSRYAEKFLSLFHERIGSDLALRRQFAEHYALFKRGIIADAAGDKGDSTMSRQQRRQAARAMRKFRVN